MEYISYHLVHIKLQYHSTLQTNYCVYFFRHHIAISNDSYNFFQTHPAKHFNKNEISSKKYDTNNKSFPLPLFSIKQTRGNENHKSSQHAEQRQYNVVVTEKSSFGEEEIVVSHMNQNHKNIAAAAVAAAKYENSLQRKMNSGNNQGIRKTFKNHFAQQKHETGDKLNEKNNRMHNSFMYWNMKQEVPAKEQNTRAPDSLDSIHHSTDTIGDRKIHTVELPVTRKEDKMLVGTLDTTIDSTGYGRGDFLGHSKNDAIQSSHPKSAAKRQLTPNTISHNGR